MKLTKIHCDVTVYMLVMYTIGIVQLGLPFWSAWKKTSAEKPCNIFEVQVGKPDFSWFMVEEGFVKRQDVQLLSRW